MAIQLQFQNVNVLSILCEILLDTAGSILEFAEILNRQLEITIHADRYR